jgi:molybdate transport system substrate-binding protein
MVARASASRFVWMLAFVAALHCVASCRGNANAPNARKADITVFAAAALTDVLPEVGEAFEARTGKRVRFSFGATGDLARQIKDGAPADVFFSSSREWADKAHDWGLLGGKPARVATNGLGCVVSSDSKSSIKAPKDLCAPAVARIAMCDENVPAGKYAREALSHLRLLDALKPRFVGQKDVRAALNAAAGGEIDAAIVYDTDARADSRVRLAFTFDAGSHTPVEHFAAAVKTSGALATAGSFIEFVLGKEGQAIFKSRGFGPGRAP